MYPLNSQVIADTPDRKFFYQREAMLSNGTWMNRSSPFQDPGKLLEK